MAEAAGGIRVRGSRGLVALLASVVATSGLAWGLSEAGQEVPRVSSVGPERGLDPFYRKVVEVGGLPVIGSEKVADPALREAAYLVSQMLRARPDILEAMAGQRARLVVMAATERTTDVPEHRNMKPKDFWDVRARGLGATRENPVVSCAEENLLNYPGDPYANENIMIHEFAHAIHGLALRDLDPSFEPRLREAFKRANQAGLWRGLYAGTNPGEYWAEGVQSWFDCNLPPDFQHNEVNTREELEAYDPRLAALLAEVFRGNAWRYVPPSRRDAAGRAHLEGFDPAHSPRFSWGSAKAKYDEVVAEKQRQRERDSKNRRPDPGSGP